MTMKHRLSKISLTLFAAVVVLLLGSLMNNAVFSDADAAGHPCEGGICELDYESPRFGFCTYQDSFTCRMDRNKTCHVSPCREME